MKSPLLGIVVPCYNEQEVLTNTNHKLTELLEDLIGRKVIDPASFICYVDDGSRDTTWNIIDEFSQSNLIKGIKLSRNCGHQAALLAGVEECTKQSDCIVTIDADLQDDISVIENMVEAFKNGDEIVYGVRNERKKDGFFKKHTAQFFYKLMHALGVNVVYNSADFRLTSKRVNVELSNFNEVNLFLRGIFPDMGFKQSKVYYGRKEREAGETKYPLRKMLSFAFEGITSFSVKPLRLITVSGLLIFFICFVLSIFVLVSYLQGNVERGWSSTVLPSYLLGGLQIFFLGIIGEYLGKIYKEIKRRPRYLIEEKKL